MSAASIAQAALPRDIGLWEWLGDPDNWTGNGGILPELRDTVQLCAVVIAVSCALAIPTAALLAHYRKAEFLAGWVVSIGRAVPTFAIAGLLVPISLRAGWGFEPWPILIALTLLALPPIFLNTYTAIASADRGTVAAARGVGLTERAVLLEVEMALSATVIWAGVRVAAVQVVATEPIRAFLGGDGLGRYVRDGLGQNNDSLVLGGAMLVATLAVLTGLVFSGFERLVLPQGVRRLDAKPKST